MLEKKEKIISNRENLTSTITNLTDEYKDYDIATVEEIEVFIQNFMNDIVEFFK
jgi:hypothetical protein